MEVVISSPVIIAYFAYWYAMVFPSHPECPFGQIRDSDLPFVCSVSSFCRMLTVDNVTVLPDCLSFWRTLRLSLHMRNFVAVMFNVSI